MVQDLNKTFLLSRTVVFGVVSLFSFIVLILGAVVTHWTNSLIYGGYFAYAALGIATSILTLFTLPAMLFFSIKRQGAITSKIAIELGWTWFLWVLWLSVGGSAASTYWIGNCSYLYYSDGEGACRSTQALTAFAFLNWIALFAYNVTLIALVIRQHMRGNTSVWTNYVTETDYTAPSTGPAIPPVNHEAKPSENFAPQYTGTTDGSNPQQPVPAQHPPYPQV